MITLKRLIVVMAAVLISPISALAVPLTLESPGTEEFQQTLNSPGIIGDPSMNNPAGFDFTLIGPALSSWTLSSPVYTIQQIRDIVGDTFLVGIDVNVAQSTHVLGAFSMTINGAVAFELPSPPLPADLAVLNNGNGWSDALIRGFDISGLDGSLEAFFTASLRGADDGREQFFLHTDEGDDEEPEEPVIPEPATLSLLALGLGLAGASRSRRMRKAE